MKFNYNLTYTRESLWGKLSIKFKRSMKFLLKDMAGLKKGLPPPKGGNLAWAPNTKNDLTRAPMYRKALPFTQYHF